MKQINVELVQDVDDYVTRLLVDQLSETIVFHNLDHARYVVDNAAYVGKNSNLSDNELNLLRICAWFHDAGYVINPEDHEAESARLAAEFLSEKGVNEHITEQVRNIIMSTTNPQYPKELISQILCDADLKHLAEDNYLELIDNLRLEWGNLRGKKFGKRKFYKMSVKFFKKHNYHTDFAKRELQPGKEKNFELLQKEIIMLEQKKEKKIQNRSEEKEGKRIFTWSGVHVQTHCP